MLHKYEYELVHYPLEVRDRATVDTLNLAGAEGWRAIHLEFDRDHRLASAILIREVVGV